MDRPMIPERLIDAVRKAMEAGITTDELEAVLLLYHGMVKMSDQMEPLDLVGRCREIHQLMLRMKARDERCEKKKLSPSSRQ